MTATLTIKLSDEVLEALRASKTITIALGSSGRTSPAARTGTPAEAAQPREGTLPARVLDWAQKRGTTFRTADIQKALGLKRAHASMLLSRLASGGTAMRRVRRGVFVVGDGAVESKAAPASTRRGGKKPKKRAVAAPREGSIAARILDWAQARGSFGVPDVVREFGIKRGHASMEMSKLANGARPIRRTGRGVYEYAGAPPRRRKTVKKRK